MTKILILLLLGISLNSQNFSCNYGKRAACLDYGDTVCSGKCVQSNAECFSAHTCNFEGFMCKSDYSSLLDDYNSNVRKYKNLASDYDDLVYKFNSKLSQYNDAEDCVSYAQTAEEARNCFY